MNTAICAYCRHEVPASSYCAVCGAPLVKTQKELEGTLLNQSYLIETMIGEGASGRLYRAKHIATGQVVALKLLQPELSTNPKSIRRFRREAEVGIRLQHPHAVKLFEFGISKESGIFMVMELIEGKSLQDQLIEEGFFSPERSIDIAIQICEVLDKAHNLQIIHRDLKPANLLMEWHPDSKDFVKVCDFGLAKMELPSTDETRLTVPGTIYGTPGYMAPEQCLGEEADPRTDLYALGVTLYEMLSGKLPFAGSTPIELIMRPLQTDPMPLHKANAALTQYPRFQMLEDAVMKCLSRAPEKRFNTAASLKLDLQMCLPSNPQQTRTTTSLILTPPPPTAFPWSPVRLTEKQLDDCRQMMSSAPTQNFLAAQTIFQKDQIPARFFLIKEGEIRIIAHDSKHIVELDRLGAGDFVGVGSFFSRSPYTLTAEAANHAELHVIDRNTFSGWMQANKDFQALFHPFYHEFLLQEVMRYSSFFSPIPPQHRSECIASCEIQPVGRGQDILQQGEVGNSLYIVASGRIEVYWPESGDNTFDSRYISGGEFFGELSLLNNQPVSASVRAISNAVLLRLPRESILEIINQYPAIRDLLRQVADERRKENEESRLNELNDTITSVDGS